MKFWNLEVLFAVAWHHELDGGDLTAVGRLEARNAFGAPGRLLLLEREVEWKETAIEIPFPEVEAIVDSLRAVSADGQPPRVASGGTGNTAWHSLTLAVKIDERSWLLALNPLDEMRGSDVPALQAFFRKLGSAAGLNGRRLERVIPVEARGFQDFDSFSERN